MLAAGLDGVKNKMDCPEPLNNLNIWNLSEEERASRGIDSLPGSLAEAMHEFEASDVIKDALGSAICDVFSRAKWAEVDEYRTRVTDWEIARYLELA